MAGKKKVEKLSLEQKAAKILEEAEKKGLSENYFFQTTFERYQTQLKIMNELNDSIDIEGPLVEKTYVKDRPCLSVNPAISEYNKTASAANGTVTTLIKILASFSGATGLAVSSQPEEGSLGDFLTNRLS